MPEPFGYRIAIVSTGLKVHDAGERRHLLELKSGTVVLDEAHKARRRGGLGQKKEAPNNLLDFMLKIGLRAKNLLLGTATPIQTEVHELWDLMQVLNTGADFVLRRELYSRWVNYERALPVVKGDETPFLTSFHSEGKTWLEHGCIIFSQYYDPAYALGEQLAKSLAGVVVGVYAGAGKSGLFRATDFASVEREDIKHAVKKREIRLVVATDAA